MEVQFQYTSGGAQFLYKTGYTLRTLADADVSFVKVSGYWYDNGGTLHPAGSVFSSSIINEIPPMGPSLGLANF
jgi:hypothetical protein